MNFSPVNSFWNYSWISSHVSIYFFKKFSISFILCFEIINGQWSCTICMELKSLFFCSIFDYGKFSHQMLFLFPPSPIIHKTNLFKTIPPKKENPNKSIWFEKKISKLYFTESSFLILELLKVFVKMTASMIHSCHLLVFNGHRTQSLKM